jgi:PadR family transcriptional regulator, regulatory protein PadR
MTVEPDRRSQFLRGALDMCTLALLHDRPSHAYELAARLEKAGLAGVSYGTVYPLVTRLRRLGLVDESTEASQLGPPRRIYRLSEEGRRTLTRWAADWLAGVTVLQELLAATGVLSEISEETR